MKKNADKPVPVIVTASNRDEGVHQDTDYSVLLNEIREMISSTRNKVAYGVNRETVLLYWNIGARIYQDVLQKDRGEYGRKIVATLSRQLLHEYGRGFSRANVFSMIRLAELYHNPGIVQTLSGQLSWSHFVELIKIDDDLQRDFYAEMCRIERWSVRHLKAKVTGQHPLS